MRFSRAGGGGAGPKLFAACPMDVVKSHVWFTDLWNYFVVSYLAEAVAQSLQVRSTSAIFNLSTATRSSFHSIYILTVAVASPSRTSGVVVNLDLGERLPRPRSQQRGSLRPRARRVAMLGWVREGVVPSR